MFVRLPRDSKKVVVLDRSELFSNEVIGANVLMRLLSQASMSILVTGLAFPNFLNVSFQSDAAEVRFYESTA